MCFLEWKTHTLLKLSLYIILLLLVNFLGVWPRVHPKSLKVGHGGTLDHTATGILGTEPLRSIIIYVEVTYPYIITFPLGWLILW